MPVDFLTQDQEQRYGRYTGEPTPEHLARYFYLDRADQQRIAQRRDDHTRLGFALQLATVRYLGTFLEDPTDVPPGVIVHLTRQLGLTDSPNLDRYRAGTVRWDHTAEIRQLYGYRQYSEQPGHFQLLRWLFARAWLGTERPIVLFERAIAWLRERKILLPGVTVLEREIARIRDHANDRLWRVLARSLTPAQCDRLEGLLVVPPDRYVSPLDRLRRLPTAPSGQGLLDVLARLVEVRGLAVGAIDLSRLPLSRLQVLARFATLARAQALARMPTERRIATLLAFVRVHEANVHDAALDMLDEVMTDIVASATRADTQARVRTLKDLDASALQLADIASLILDPTIADAALRATILDRTSSADLAAVVAQVRAIARPPGANLPYDELKARYRRISRFRPTLLNTISFDALPAGQAVLDGYRFLQQIERKEHRSMRAAPLDVVSRAWKRYVVQDGHTVDRTAYTCCVLDRLVDALRRREVFVWPSRRYADPRLGMLMGKAWEIARPQICRALGRSVRGADDLAALAKQLDATYRATAAGIPQNAAVTLTMVNGKPDLTLSPLDKLEEPLSLVTLRSTMDAMVPLADLPEVLLEIHRRTGFANEFTHVSEGDGRADDLPISICAVLIAEACNIGLRPLVNPAIPALTYDRLTWVQQNYMRAETLTRANARLVDTQSGIWLAQRWGGGDVASADGMRFVVPLRTIAAGENPKLLGKERGITYYNLTSDQFTGLNGIVVTGTLRDSLVLLSLLLGQQTPLQPSEIMTDTGAYADSIFGLLWLLGYQFSPRISDVGGARFWRIDRSADYGALNRLARHTINTKRIEQQWDELLRLAGSLMMGVFQVESLMRTLQRRDRPTEIGRALQELGRIIKSLFLLQYVSDESYRRRILIQLNRGEGRHRLARAVFYGQRGELRQRYREGQEDQLSALGLVVNIIVLWNTLYMDRILAELRTQGQTFTDEDVARLSPLRYEHLNFLGRFLFELDEPLARGEWRPLREWELVR